MAKKSKTRRVSAPLPPPEPEPPQRQKPSFRVRLPGALPYAVGLLVLMLFLFRAVLPPDQALLTTDDNFGQLAYRKQLLPAAFSGTWTSAELLGFPVRLTPNFIYTSLWLLPLKFYTNWFHGLTLAVGSLFFGLFLRRRGLGWPAICIAALTAYWLGSNFTLTFAGHIGKFGLLMFTGIFLWVLDLALERRNVPWAVLAGAAFGALFMDQQDSGFFFALVLGPYVLFRSWRVFGRDLPAQARFLAPLFGVALLTAVHPLWSTYRQFGVEDVTATADDPETHWEFITQWSWPPEETIDFIAPGFMGWRSGDAAGPYWGRMGRSAGWERHRQGFGNFKLENQYLGAIPLVAAFWALFAALRLKRREDGARAEVLFWSIACLVTFLLACGKYIEPLYRAFAALPIVSSIRNPNKFLQIYQIAVAILAGYGIDGLLGRRRAAWLPQLSREFHITVFSLLCLLLVFAGLWWGGSAFSVESLAESKGALGFGDGQAIAGNMVRALGHATAMLALVAAVLGVFTLWKKSNATHAAGVGAYLLVAVVVVDASLLSRHYVQSMNIDPIVNNRVGQMLSELLRAKGSHQRVALTSQSGFYNLWLTYVFPYHGIQSLNITAAPRLAEDYRRFLDTLQQDTLRLWQLTGVGYILAPASVWSELNRNPLYSHLFELHYAYNVEPVGAASARAVDATESRPGQHCVIHFAGAAPRFGLVDRWEVLPGEEALAALAAPDYEPFSRVFLSPDRDPPPPPDREEGGLTGTVEVRHFSPGRVELRVQSGRDAILRIADKFDPGWQATVSGREATVHRCDYIMQGVHVPAGVHTVELVYSAPNPTRWFQYLSFAVVLGAVGVLVKARRSGG